MPEQRDGTGLRDAVLSEHALLQMARRQVLPAEVRAVLSEPEVVPAARPGRVVAEKVLVSASGRRYLFRVFVDVDRHPPRGRHGVQDQ